MTVTSTMSFPAGTHTFDPASATVTVRTGRRGAAAKAGHDLLIQLDDWKATLTIGEDPAQAGLSFESNAASLRVIEGTGGLQALDDADKANIAETIVTEILDPQEIRFESSSVQIAPDGAGLAVAGDLTLAGQTHPIAFELAPGDDGKLHGSVVLTQTDWGIKPYSALFGALKVADDVEVLIDVA